MTEVTVDEGFSLFEHQEDALEAGIQAYESGEPSANIVLFTGGGKTEVLARIIDQVRQDQGDGRPGLLLTHSQGILRQTETTMRRVSGPDTTVGYVVGNEIDDRNDVVLAGLQKMTTRFGGGMLYEAFDPEEFSVIGIDEAHIARATLWEKAIRHFSPAFLIGGTATPYRHDGRNIAEVVGQNVYTKTLAEAIAERLVAPMSYNVYADQLRPAEEILEMADKLSIEQLDRKYFVEHRDDEVAEIFGTELEQTPNPHGLIFCKSIEHAERMAEVVDKHLPYTVAPIHSRLKPKDFNFYDEAFRSGELQLATVVGMYGEGTDIPSLNFLGFLRNTASERMWLQNIGRSTRPEPDKLVRIADLVMSYARITMIDNLQREVKEIEAGQADPIMELQTGLTFTFSQEAKDVQELAHYVRQRNAARQVEIDAKRAAKAAKTAAAAFENIKPGEHAIPELLQGLAKKHSAKNRGREPYNPHDDNDSNTIGFSETFGGWSIVFNICKESVFNSSHPELQNTVALIAITNSAIEEWHSDHPEEFQSFFAIDSKGEIIKLTLPEGAQVSHLKVGQLFDFTYEEPQRIIKQNLGIESLSPEEMRRLEALMHLSLSGIDKKSARLRDVEYQGQLARNFGETIERFMLGSQNGSWSPDKFGWLSQEIRTPQHRVDISIQDKPAIIFPGVHLNEQVVAQISVMDLERGDRTYSEVENESRHYVLLADGTIKGLDIIKKEDGSIQNWLGRSRDRPNLPSNEYDYRFKDVDMDEGLGDILDLIKETTGEYVDWSKITPEDLFKASLSYLGPTPEYDGQDVSKTDWNAMQVVKQAVALQIADMLGLAEPAELRKAFNLKQRRSLQIAHRRANKLRNYSVFQAGTYDSFKIDGIAYDSVVRGILSRLPQTQVTI